MKAKVIALIAVWLALWQLMWLINAQSTARLPERLIMIEVVSVLNYSTSVRVNLESCRGVPERIYKMDADSLNTNTTTADVIDIVTQGNEYSCLCSNGVVNLVPKERLHDPEYIFNQTVNDFSVTNCDLFVTMGKVVTLQPKLISMDFSLVPGDNYTDPKHDLERARGGCKEMTFHLRNAAYRDIFNEIVRQQGNSYWMTPPWPGDYSRVAFYSSKGAKGIGCSSDSPVLNEKRRIIMQDSLNKWLESKKSGSTNHPGDKK